MSLSTGSVVPAACRANRCPHCGPRNALAVAGAVALACPERFVTLTQVGEDWQTVRGRLRRIAWALRAAQPEHRWCWHVEPNPAGTGHHVHAWQRGGYLPQRLVSDVARRQGVGAVADIRRWRQDPSAKLTYGVKLTGVFYGVKTAAGDEGMATYLDANGGRLVHASRGWWLDPAGRPCTQRRAMEWAMSSGEPDDAGPWELVREDPLGVLGALLSDRASYTGEGSGKPANDPQECTKVEQYSH